MLLSSKKQLFAGLKAKVYVMIKACEEACFASIACINQSKL